MWSIFWYARWLENLFLIVSTVFSPYHAFSPCLCIFSHSFKHQVKCHHLTDAFLTILHKCITFPCLLSFTSGSHCFFRHSQPCNYYIFTCLLVFSLFPPECKQLKRKCFSPEVKSTYLCTEIKWLPR